MNANEQASPQFDIDLSLYLVINPEQCHHYAPVEVALMAASGGASAVQVRGKSLDFPTFVKLVENVYEALQPFNIPVFVNDRVDVAKAAGVNCVHLGQKDMPASEAMEILGPNAHIGLTVSSMQEAEEVPGCGLSYISIGRVFPTKSKKHEKAPIGLTQLKAIVQNLRKQHSTIPIVAISGINLSNVESVLKSGVNGVALVSEICESDNPQQSTVALRESINRYLNLTIELT